MVPMIIRTKIKRLKSREKKATKTKRGTSRVTLVFCSLLSYSTPTYSIQSTYNSSESKPTDRS